ncbi:MAG: phospho-sugar mutase [Clostridiales bacterium]|nr:phospho-sugar mutase [Clostridiales bacterium]
MTYLEMYDHFLNSGELTAEEKERMASLTDSEKKEFFSIPLEFGTAGMRGVLDIGTNRMNIYNVRRATLGLAKFINSLGKEAAKKGIVISYDTRRYSSEFACAAAKVLAKEGIKVYLFENVRPVPMCSFAIRYLNATGGIMITASHNPKQYNGYKVYGEDGAQLSPEATAKVVEYINKLDYFNIPECEIKLNAELIKGKDNLKVSDNITIIGKSVDDVYFSTINKLSLSPEAVKEVGSDIKIVYTPLHGSGYMPVTTILAHMGIKVTVVSEQAKPDTEFSTVRVPNPEEPDALKMAIELADKIGSDLVIGTDPDCDRMGVAVRNDKGEFVLLNGNQIGALLLDYILKRNKENGTLPKNAAVVKTIVTTELAADIARSYGAEIFDVLTGFKFIGEKIKEWEKTNEHTFMFGYEESYGYLSGTHARDKDAVVSAMLFAEMACYYKKEGAGIYQTLIYLFEKFGYYNERSVSITYGGLDGMEKMKNIMEYARAQKFEKIAGNEVAASLDLVKGIRRKSDGAEEEIKLPRTNALKLILKNGDWICIRPSGTEPKLKIYVAAKAPSMEQSKEICERYLEEMKKILS